LGRVYTGIVAPYVLPALQAATRSLDIVSPYLSPEYAQLLRSKASAGVRVRLITSDSTNRYHREALYSLRQSNQEYALNLGFWWYLVLALTIGSAGLMLGQSAWLKYVASITCLVIIAIGLRKHLTRRQTGSIPLYLKMMPGQFVHVKLYVIDAVKAIVGSANLTYSGMNKNIERIEEKTESAEIQQEMRVFESLWGEGPPAGTDLRIRWKNKAIFRSTKTN